MAFVTDAPMPTPSATATPRALAVAVGVTVAWTTIAFVTVMEFVPVEACTVGEVVALAPAPSPETTPPAKAVASASDESVAVVWTVRLSQPVTTPSM